MATAGHYASLGEFLEDEDIHALGYESCSGCGCVLGPEDKRFYPQQTALPIGCNRTWCSPECIDRVTAEELEERERDRDSWSPWLL